MTVIKTAPPYTIANCSIVRDADWDDQMPRFLDGDETEPTDLTGKTIEIYIRPVFDHSVLIKKLSTEAGTIIVDDPADGLASIFVDRAEVIADLPVGVWDWFCVESEATEADPADGFRSIERFRGRLTVHPGRITE